MKISAICHGCGDIAEADYLAWQLKSDTTDTRSANQPRMVRIHCPSCGTYERPPHCQPDLTDTGLLRMLVL